MKNTKGLIAAIEAQESLADAAGELAEAREEAIDHYLGKPYGNEVEGRSQVVMRDVADTIEWIKPSLMKVFASGDEVCRFDPRGPEDIQQAEQETEYCNYILNQKNNGFLILHDWFHDALLQRTGYVMVQYETEKVADKATYRGLSDDEFALLMQGKPEVLEHTAYPGPVGIQHDITVRKVEEYGCTKITNIAPERVKISADWPDLDLQGCPFVEVIDRPTISELRQQGYTVDDKISDSASGADDDLERGQEEWAEDDQEADPATRRVKVRYVWIRYDEDGDGIAELRKVVVIGTTILENEETDITPIAAITPTRIPHEHYGLSIDDVVSDLQEIRTALTRGFLDNMYLANNGRYAIDANVVNLDDMLVSRPGGVVRVNGPVNGAMLPMVHPQEGGTIIQAIEYVDTVRENRTGVTKYNQGLDSQSLNKTAHGMNQIMNASQQRIELIARMFAETGVKSLFLLIHAISVANGRKAEMIRLREEWFAVEPGSWKTRRDVSVSVGLGTGNKDQMLAHLQLILMAQKEALMIGVAKPENIYHSLTKLTENAGFKDSEKFWTDPSKAPPQPPAPSPEMVKAQAEIEKSKMEAQADAQKFAAQSQIDAQTAQVKMEAQKQLEAQKLQFEAAEKEKDRQLQIAIAAIKRQTELELAGMQIDSGAGMESAGKVVNRILEAISELGHVVTAPREIVRDEDGRIAGVAVGGKVRPVRRDEAGRVAGIG